MTSLLEILDLFIAIKKSRDTVAIRSWTSGFIASLPAAVSLQQYLKSHCTVTINGTSKGQSVLLL